MKKSFLFSLAILFGSSFISATEISEALFTIDGKPVSSQEFSYIYQKNSINGQADFTKSSLDDYLKLFINYKLKVRQAKDLGLDTVSALVNEYEGYRKQLLETHIQRQIVDPLVRQEYERSKKDVAISHIFIDKKTESAQKKINEALQKLKNGEDFASLAKIYSQDQQSAANGGKIGYFTALQIGFPQIENAIYNTPKGSFSDIVQTDLGYHIIRVDDVRPARGRVKVAIIKLNFSDDPAKMQEVKNRADSLYQLLNLGAKFSDLAVKHSDDVTSGMRGGELEWFGINTYVKEFEDVAFGLKKDGEYSAPFATASSWYIIKRVMAAEEQSFEDAESVIKSKLMRSRMYNEQLEKFSQHLKAISQLKRYDENIAAFEEKLVTMIDSFPFVYPHEEKSLPLLSISGKNYDQNQMAELIRKNIPKVTEKQGKDRVEALFNMTLDDLLMGVYEQTLVDSLYDYRSLLDEYKNGVLIFELTKNKIWNKATTDTTGLQNFYRQMGDKYMWNPRAEVLRIQSEDELNEKTLSKIIKKNNLTSLEAWNEYLAKNQEVKIKVTAEMVEKGVSEDAEQIVWTAGLHTSADKKLYQVTKVLPAQKKELSEVRGFVVAAYQEHLEKEWLNELHKAYNVRVDDKVLQNLYR